MSDAFETFEHNGYKVEIYSDFDPTDPREEYDHVGRLTIFGSSWNHLSDKEYHLTCDKDEFLRSLIDCPTLDRVDALVEELSWSHRCMWEESQALSAPIVMDDVETRMWQALDKVENAKHSTYLLRCAGVDTDPIINDLIDVMEDTYILPANIASLAKRSTESARELIRRQVFMRRANPTAKRRAFLEEKQKALLEAALNEAVIALPISIYEHNSYSIKAWDEPCWDSENIDGWIYVPWDKARQEWEGTDEEIRAKALKCLKAEVEEYDQYLQGDVWGYVIKDVDGAEVDLGSCWGFYGLKYARECAKEAVPTHDEDGMATIPSELEA
jgi:glycine cleavage system regulatory protein